MKNNSITKNELSITLNKLIEPSLQVDKPCVDLSDDAKIKMIVNKYKEAGYLEELSELMGIVIHKARSPLARISAAVEILRERVEKSDVNEKFFEMIIREIDCLKSTSKNLVKAFPNK